jgi:hypothetical protein
LTPVLPLDQNDRADDPTGDGFPGRAMGFPCAEPLGRRALSADNGLYVAYALIKVAVDGGPAQL